MGNTGNMRAMVKICGKYVGHIWKYGGIKDPWWKKNGGLSATKSEVKQRPTIHVGNMLEVSSAKMNYPLVN